MGCPQGPAMEALDRGSDARTFFGGFGALAVKKKAVARLCAELADD
jgi:hypothetical protein